MPYITSTISTDVKYALYTKLPGNVYKIIKEILVKGGANVANKLTLVTPSGVATKVSDEELELLEKNPVFKQHKAAGFVTVVKTTNRYEAEDKADSLSKADGSAQLTPKHYKKQGKKAPKTGAK